MPAFFFYGSLMDDEVVQAILSKPLRILRPRAAVLPGYRRVYVAGTLYPAIIQDSHSRVEGLLVSDVTRQDQLKLDRFEGVGYAAQPVDVLVAEDIREIGLVYQPKRGLRLTDKVWSLSEWQRKHKARCRPDWQGPLRSHR